MEQHVQVVGRKIADGAKARPAGWRSVLTHTHTYSGRPDHGGAIESPESYRQLTAWAARLGIDALGLGSPWEPVSAVRYGRYDGDPSLAYYRGVDPASVMDREPIEGMIRQLNSLSSGRPLFYLDNETPKGRFGHLWWVGYRYDFPAWHDYDQPFDRWMIDQSEGDGDEPMPYERRPYMQIVATQRAAGAAGVWAHPTSWWPGERGQFVTNIASEMPAHAIADGMLDGLVIMGYHAFRPPYLALWHELLDRGYRVPGVAEMDCGLSDPALWTRDSALVTLAFVGGELSSAGQLASAFRTGRLIATSGPFIEISVDGTPMGQATATSAGHVHHVRLTALPSPGESELGQVELVGPGGEVLWSARDFAGGTIELSMTGSPKRGYLYARAFGQGQSSATAWRDMTRLAVSNPVYLHPAGDTFLGPATTELTLHFAGDSPLLGGRVLLESATGDSIEAGTIRVGALRRCMPANGRITLVPKDGEARTLYLINANPRLAQLQRYLYRGRFRRDFAGLAPGEVPPAAWRLDEYGAAMRELRLDL